MAAVSCDCSGKRPEPMRTDRSIPRDLRERGILMRIGEQIRARREELCLTQEELAEKLDISRQAVSKWESGASAPTAENLRRLSQTLDAQFDKTGKEDTDPHSIADQDSIAEPDSIADLWDQVEEQSKEKEPGDDPCREAKHGKVQVKNKKQLRVPQEKTGRGWKAAAIAGWLILAAVGCFAGYRYLLRPAEPAADQINTPQQPAEITGVYFYDNMGNEVLEGDNGYPLSDSDVLIAVYRGEAPDTVSVCMAGSGAGTEEEGIVISGIEDRGYVLIPLSSSDISLTGQLKVVLRTGTGSVSSRNYPVYYEEAQSGGDAPASDSNVFDTSGYADGEWIATDEADKFTADYLEELENGQRTKDFDETDVLLSFLAELNPSLPGCSRRIGETNSEYEVSILDLNGAGADGTLWVKVRRKLLDTSYNKDLEVWYVSEYKYDSRPYE